MMPLEDDWVYCYLAYLIRHHKKMSDLDVVSMIYSANLDGYISGFDRDWLLRRLCGGAIPWLPNME